MKIFHQMLLLVIALCTWSCNENIKEEGNAKITKTTESDLSVDHLNIWVKNPEKAKVKLVNIGFTAVADSLSQVHHGQGTTGKYFNFLNGYLELIFVYNHNEFNANNNKNKDLYFFERFKFEENFASPFSIALKIKDYKVDKIPFEKISYQQDWMENDSKIYSAKNSKLNLKEPSVFVVYPKIESNKFKSIYDLTQIPDEYAFYRETYKHRNGAEKITKIIITSPDLNTNTKTIKALNSIKNLIVKTGQDYLMTLYFDNQRQGKSFDLRPELPLKIYL